ncbi:MAG TPA: capsule biosynthesis protein CapJ [Candidatus Kerfeldbacteria bacterium]|nr:capsule biosynthesis protein CapJ [Candidatus Kerfeldbacteria bacterium]
MNRPFSNRQRKTIGHGTWLTNAIFQTILGINRASFMVHYTSRISFPDRIQLVGSDEHFDAELCLASSISCYLQARNGLIIDRSVRFAAGVKMISANHNLKNPDYFDHAAPLTIHKRVWIGANVVLLPGINIGENTVVGAGSVVSRSLPANVVAAGCPCRIIRNIDD